MSANPQLRRHEYPFDPGILMAALEACPASLAVAENGRILFADTAFGAALSVSHSSPVQGRLLSDLLPQNTKYIDSWDGQPHPGAVMQVEAFLADFEENRRAFQVIRIRSVPRKENTEVPLWESQKMEAIGRLTAGIAYDFNNLLTGILLYSDLLIAQFEPGSRVGPHAQAIHKAATDGMALIQQLMNPVHDTDEDVKPLSWSQVISDMGSVLTLLVGADVEIETKLAESLSLVKLDRGQAERIILNLVMNARHAIPEVGKITLSTEDRTSPAGDFDRTKPVSFVEFSVTDTGTGMDKKTLAKVFRPLFYHQAKKRRQRVGTDRGARYCGARGGQGQDRQQIGGRPRESPSVCRELGSRPIRGQVPIRNCRR